MQSRELSPKVSVLQGRVPPQALEAEETILGGILLDPGAIARVAEILKPEYFYMKAHGEIYRAAAALHQLEQPIDFITVANWLKAHQTLDQVGGQSKILSLIDSTVSAANIDHYAELVAQKWRRRELFRAGQLLCQQAYDEEIPLETVTDEAERAMAGLGASSRAMQRLEDELIGTFVEIEERSNNPNPSGLATGFYDLDGMTQGFQPSDLIIVAGRPSMGKTAFAIAAMANAAQRCQAPMLFFSLEMSNRQLAYRILSQYAQIEMNRMRLGQLSEGNWGSLAQAIADLADRNIYLNESPVQSVADIRTHCRKMAAKHGELGLICIDYLQLIGGDSENRVQEISKISRSLKLMAKELNVPVVALSQLSRAVEQRTNKRPMMSDLRESGALEQDADLVMMLYRDEYYNQDTQDRGIAELILTKHRNGPVGTVKLLFDPQYSQFRNLAKGSH